MNDSEPIAVVGLSCRFPGDATNADKFWELLCKAKSTHSKVPSERFNGDAYHWPNRSKLNTTISEGGHFLGQNVGAFDANFFGLSHLEVSSVDPQQRMMLEVTYEAFESAGLSMETMAGSNTSCFVGASQFDYQAMLFRDAETAPPYSGTASSVELLSNRLSWFYDLRGPSMSLGTACSSSLVALHQACQSIRSGEANMAVAGAVNLLLGPDMFTFLSNQQFLSPDGLCKSFDASANGYGRSEGIAAIVLKRASDAIRDGDPIRAIIRGTGVNQDGKTKGLTIPNADAQADLIRATYRAAGLDWKDTDYFEAHGTGTRVGDPLELSAIGATLGSVRQKGEPLIVGSVKSNIGHAEACAGFAGLIKCIYMLEKGMIPANIHYHTPNPEIQFDAWNLTVPTQLTRWPGRGPASDLRRASINSFGYGGTNAHAILESAEHFLAQRKAINGVVVNGFVNGVSPATLPQPPQTPQPRIFVFSAHDREGLDRQQRRFADHLRTQLASGSLPADYLDKLAFTLSNRRSRLPWKLCLTASSLAELAQRLEDTASNKAAAHRAASKSPRLGFVFTGQGAQWAQMGVELCKYAVFDDSVRRSDELLASMGCTWSAREELLRPAGESKIHLPEYSQPLCTLLQMALVDLLEDWGVKPCAVVGHSSGEIAAAFCLGALTREDALRAAYCRGRSSEGALGKGKKGSDADSRSGAMLAAGLSVTSAWSWIDKVDLIPGELLSIACVNSPSSVTFSGTTAAIDTLEGLLTQEGVFARKLQVGVAYHSPLMERVVPQYMADICDIVPQEAHEGRRMYSSVTGTLISASALGPENWVRNLVSTVEFSDALYELLKCEDVETLVEIGPHSALRGPIQQVMKAYGVKGVEYRSLLSRGKNNVETALACVGDLFTHGVVLDINRINTGTHPSSALPTQLRPLTDLPSYSWNHSQTFWGESRVVKQHRLRSHPAYSLVGAPTSTLQDAENCWRSVVRLSEETWIRDHQIQTSVLYPGTGYIAMAIEASCQMADRTRIIKDFKLRDIQFDASTVLTEEAAVEFNIQIRPHVNATRNNTASPWYEFKISTSEDGGDLQQKCSGLLLLEYHRDADSGMNFEQQQEDQNSRMRLHEVASICKVSQDANMLYEEIATIGLNFGPTFRNITEIRKTTGHSYCKVNIPHTDISVYGPLDRPHIIHPGTLDSMFQCTIPAINGEKGLLEAPLVPSSIDELVVFANIPFAETSRFEGFTKASQHGFNQVVSEIRMFDLNSGMPAVKVDGLRCTAISILGAQVNQDNLPPTKLCSQVIWQPYFPKISAEKLQALIDSVSTDSPAVQVPYTNGIAENVVTGRPSHRDFTAMSTIHPNWTTRAGGKVNKLVQLMAFTSPGLSVLELELGTGLMVPSILSDIDSDLVDYTVSSSDQDRLEKAKEQLKLQNTSPDFRLLELNKDPTNQGFTKGSFDLIITSLDIYHNGSPAEGLASVKTLLKPGGMICSVITPTDFADTKAWEELLMQAGFTLRIGSTDVGDLILAQAPQPAMVQEIVGEMLILESQNASEKWQEFADQLVAELERSSVKARRMVWSAETASLGSSSCISLLEAENPFLADLDEKDFNALKKMILTTKSILWVAFDGAPSGSLVSGFSRTLRNEMPTLEFRTLHIQPDSLTSSHLASLVADLATSTTLDHEFKEVDGMISISRLVADVGLNTRMLDLMEKDKTIVKALGEVSTPLKLHVRTPGALDSLCWAYDHTVPAELEPDEVEMEVKATSLNFRDVMVAMGQIPDKTLGFEASGVITRVGSDVIRFKAGDRVCTLGIGAHRTILRNKALFCQHMPPYSSFEEAATLPLVHCTAYHALVRLGRVQEGQSILIHAASGGVGQAAIQLAQHFKMEIFATVGSEVKRKLIKELYGIQDDHIFNSRDLSFSKGVMRMTDRRGVDYVLNSLSGEALRQTWHCIAPFGTFIEIGMKDILDNRGLDMYPFLQDATFVFLNLDHVRRKNPKAMGEIMEETFNLLRAGVTQPIKPLTVYSIQDVESAFRVMQMGKHLGKISFSFTPQTRLPIIRNPIDVLRLDPKATYLLVGGLGGLGRSLSNLLAHHGARNICFLSRSGDDSYAAKQQIQALSNDGVHVKAYRCDVSDFHAVQEVLKTCASEMPTIKGVIQCAMVLRDSIFENMSHQDWAESTHPKVQGSWNLHTLLGNSLSFFVILSSYSGIFGNRGQSNYAAAGTYQDALSHYRRSHGQQCTTIDLGIMRDIGVIAEKGASGDLKNWEKPFGIREPVFHALMISILSASSEGADVPAQVVTGLATRDGVSAANIDVPFYFSNPRFSILSKEGGKNNTSAHPNTNEAGSVPAKIQLARATSLSEATDIVTNLLIRKLALSLQTEISEIDSGRPLHSYGVDSLVALEIRNWAILEIGAEITVFDVLSSVPMTALAHVVAGKSKLLSEGVV